METRNQWALAIAKVMLNFVPVEARNFLLRIVEEKIFGEDRLNVAARLQLYCVSPLIILNDLFAKFHSADTLVRAVKNFSPNAISEVLRLLAENVRSPDVLLAKMRESACFKNFEVVVAETRFSEAAAADFVRIVSNTAAIPLPLEAQKLFLRVRLDVELAKYLSGETEVLDFFQICVILTKDDDVLFRHCFAHVREKSNVLARHIAETRKYEFTANPAASDFAPSCTTPFNSKLHDLACGNATVIVDPSAVHLFRKKLESARQLAIYYHLFSPDGTKTCEFLSFRLRTTIFHYSPHHSRANRPGVVSALMDHVKDKKVFVFSVAKASKYLAAEFDWVPANFIDASEVAKQNGIRPSLSDMAVHISGGDYCRRALRFPGNAIPSPGALKHLDVGASILYEFCVRVLSLYGPDIAVAYQEEEQRRSRATVRARGRNNDGNREHHSDPRSRSRLR